VGQKQHKVWLEELPDGVAKHSSGAYVGMSQRASKSSGTTRAMYNRGAQAAAFVARHPKGSMGAAAGLGAFGAMNNRRSSQGPMY